MVVVSMTPTTAKTLATLAKQLNLAQYKNIIILDDEANDVWCKHDMIELKLFHRVNIVLIQVPAFNVWNVVYPRFYAMSTPLQTGEGAIEMLYDIISGQQQVDELFVRFEDYLRRLRGRFLQQIQGETHLVLRQFAYSMPGQRMDDILWKWTSY